MELDGPINGNAFTRFIQQLLVPTLQPGDPVWLDNLSSHKIQGIQEAMEAQQAELHFCSLIHRISHPLNSFGRR